MTTTKQTKIYEGRTYIFEKMQDGRYKVSVKGSSFSWIQRTTSVREAKAKYNNL